MMCAIVLTTASSTFTGLSGVLAGVLHALAGVLCVLAGAGRPEGHNGRGRRVT